MFIVLLDSIFYVPRTLKTDSINVLWTCVSVPCPSIDTEAGTKLDTTGLDWQRNWSMESRQEDILWGKVPPTAVTLFPNFSTATPTSPIIPHWMAKPGTNKREMSKLFSGKLSYSGTPHIASIINLQLPFSHGHCWTKWKKCIKIHCLVSVYI